MVDLLEDFARKYHEEGVFTVWVIPLDDVSEMLDEKQAELGVKADVPDCATSSD